MTAEEFIKSHFKDIENRTEWYPALVAIAEGYSAHLTAENTKLKEEIAQRNEYYESKIDTLNRVNKEILDAINKAKALTPKTEYKTCTDCGTKFSSNQRCPECNPMG